MPKLSDPQVGRLRRAVVAVYGGPFGPSLFDMLLSEQLGRPLYYIVPVSEPFPIQVSQALRSLNNEGRIPELLAALEREFPCTIEMLNVIRVLRAESNTINQDDAAMARLQKLERAHLLLDGLPFIARKRLGEIMGELLDAALPRVAVVAGSGLTGKSWSMHLVRARCRAMRPKVRCILVDLERLQPGNDPVVVWVNLMEQLLRRPAPPPPSADTKRGQYVDRLVNEVCEAWESFALPDLAEEKPWPLVVFDNLDKSAPAAVGPAVVDFAEALALAANDRRLENGRVVLLGFPRGFSPPSGVARREDLHPLTLDEVITYLVEIGTVISRGAPPETRAAATQALRDVEAKATLEERRAALIDMSDTISCHVRALARA